MRHVLTSEAIAACEAQGHRFAWVPTWGDCGFEECRTCGETRGYGRKPRAGGVVADVQVEPSMPDSFVPLGVSLRVTDAESSDDSKELNVRLATERDALAADADRRPVRVRGGNADRDRAILAAVVAGERPSAVAARFGVHPSRVSQITRAWREAASGA